MKFHQSHILIALNCLFVFTIILFVLVKKIKQHKYPKKNARYIPTNQGIPNFSNQELINTNISRELHDNIGQLLSLAQMNVHYLSKEINDDFRNYKVARDTISIINQVHNIIHNISHKLSSEYISQKGLVKMLRQELIDIRIVKEINAELYIEGVVKSLKKEVELTIFRVVQEAMHNIIKHSNADCIKILLHYTMNDFQLEIVDNGIGFNVEKELTSAAKGIGIINMHQRIESIDGELNITSSEKGTSLLITLPYVYAFDTEIANNMSLTG